MHKILKGFQDQLSLIEYITHGDIVCLHLKKLQKDGNLNCQVVILEQVIEPKAVCQNQLHTV